MTNTLFSLGREGFLDGSIDWDTNDIRVMLVKSTYTFDDTDNDLADLGAVDNGRSAALGTKTVTLGVADAADTTITATAAVACNALVIFQHTGTDGTARLIAYIDIATGLPVTPAASGVVNVAWDNGANKIFKL
jgi:hypothetical protein